MTRFAFEVREARKARGLTLEVVARRIGSHKGYVSGIENAKVDPPLPRVVKKLAHVLDIPEDRLLALRAIAKLPKRCPLSSLMAVAGEILTAQAAEDKMHEAVAHSHEAQALKRETA